MDQKPLSENMAKLEAYKACVNELRELVNTMGANHIYKCLLSIYFDHTHNLIEHPEYASTDSPNQLFVFRQVIEMFQVNINNKKLNEQV